MSSSQASDDSCDISTEIVNITEEVEAFGWRQTEQSSEPLAKRQRIMEPLSPADNSLYYPDIELNERYVSYIENSLIYLSSQQTDGIEFEESDPRIKLKPDLKSYIKRLFSLKVLNWAIITYHLKGTGDWIHLRDYLKYFFVKRVYNSLRLKDVYFYGQWYSDFLMIIDEVVSDSSEPLLYRQSSDTSIQSNNNESLIDTPISSTSTNITSHSSTNNFIQNINSINRESNELSNNLISNEDSDESIANTNNEIQTELPNNRQIEERNSCEPQTETTRTENQESLELNTNEVSNVCESTTNRQQLPQTNPLIDIRLKELNEQLIQTLKSIDILSKRETSDELVNQNILLLRLRCKIHLCKSLGDFLDNSIYPMLTNASIDKQLFLRLLIGDIVPNITGNAFLSRTPIFQTIPNNTVSLIPTPIGSTSTTLIPDSKHSTTIHMNQTPINQSMFKYFNEL